MDYVQSREIAKEEIILEGLKQKAATIITQITNMQNKLIGAMQSVKKMEEEELLLEKRKEQLKELIPAAKEHIRQYRATLPIKQQDLEKIENEIVTRKQKTATLKKIKELEASIQG